MPGICLVLSKFAVKLAQRNIGVSAVIVLDPLDFLLGMSVGMRRVRTVRLRNQRFFRAVILLIPPHQRGF